jgi:choline dehydrogenase-like flavoprotein
MDLFQIKKAPTVYDAVIVGSGAGGGMAAYMLTKAGAKVCCWKQAAISTQPIRSTLRSLNGRMNRPGAVPAPPGPAVISMRPGVAGKLKVNPIHRNRAEFHWFRSRMLGGRTNHWGRISMRFGPDDFSA